MQVPRGSQPGARRKAMASGSKPGHRRPAANSELEKHRATEARLRKSLARERLLRRQQAELIRLQEMLSRESEHRLLNGLQLISSLLALQSRAIENTETVAQLTKAANRVATLGRIYRHLHALDHAADVEFKPYLEKLCRDFSEMALDEHSESLLVVEGSNLRIPAVTAIPIAFIASELTTNAIKYAKGRIRIRLETRPGQGFALSVLDEGPGLPEGFDPAASEGLGMKIVSSLVRQIGGQLQIAGSDEGQGARFTVLVS